MKQFYYEVREWLNYVRNYKEAKINEEITDGTIIELNKKIVKLKSKLELKEKQVEVLTKKVSHYANRNDELRKVLGLTMKENKELKAQVKKRKE